MEHDRWTAHTCFDIKFHLVWIIKYRKTVLRGDVDLPLRQIVQTISAEPEVVILKRHAITDHEPLLVPYLQTCRPVS